jgi:hypothetical protein
MVKMKYEVGDYLRLGVDTYIYFKVIEVKEDRYVLKRCISDGKTIVALFVTIDRLSTICKVSKTEVLLNSFNRRYKWMS